MFSIQICDQDGDERSQIFGKSEITVGRVPGNDLLLPKGNVSKRHARFIHRDGRFIVTDLRSTNGTYVNGHRIAQPTMVREGDLIHIGDFVLRLRKAEEETAVASPTTEDADATREQPMTDRAQAEIPPPTTPRSGHPLFRLPRSERAGAPSSPVPSSSRPHPSQVSPPRSVTPGRPSSLKPAQAAGEPSPERAHERALALLIRRIEERFDTTSLEGRTSLDEASLNRLARMIAELSRGLRESGEVSNTIDEGALARDATRELLELGPLGPLLDDASVTEIRVLGHDRVVAIRGAQATVVEPAFSSEAALLRVIAKLCRTAGQPLTPSEQAPSRVLPDGTFVQALVTKGGGLGHRLRLRKARRAEHDLEALVREGTLSRKMATFLSQALAARANLIIAGPSFEESCPIASAFLREGDAYTVELHPQDQPGSSRRSVLSLPLPDAGAEGAKLARGALRIGASLLFVSPFAGQVAAETLDAIAEGTQGVVATVRAPSLRRGLERLAPDLSATRPGLSSSVAREQLAASFDLAIEVARLRDGRCRVLRIAELELSSGGALEVRDVFAFSIERTGEDGDVEGSFHPTGHVPRLVEEAANRGTSIDAGLFRRGSRPD